MVTKVIGLRTDTELLEEVSELARLESEKIGIRIDRNAFINRAIREDVKKRRAQLETPAASNDNAKGAA